VLDGIARERQKEWSVSTATIVEGILMLISKNPKQDRDKLHREPIERRSRKQLIDIYIRGEQPPFREMYLSEDRDIVIYKTLINYFSAADEIFWSKKNSGLIRKTAGVQALFRVLKELLPDQLLKKDLQQSAWNSILIKAKSLDFSNMQVFESSGRGCKRIQDAILVAIGNKYSSEIKDDSFRSYINSVITERTNA
jgi:hypothetical protein